MSTLPPPPDAGDDRSTGGTSTHAELPPPPAAGAGRDDAGAHGEGPGQWQHQQPGHQQQWGQQQPWGAYGQPYRRPMFPTEERNWAMLAHLSGLSFLVGLPVVGPLVVWLFKRDQSAFVDAEGKEALNFSLSVLLYSVVGGILGAILTVVTLGIGFIAVALVGLVAGIAWLVLTILAAVQASGGQPYRYPLTIRFIR